MKPIHLIVVNLVYDLSCIALPFGNVDGLFEHPHKWRLSLLLALWFGWVRFLLPLIFWPLSYSILSFNGDRSTYALEQSLQQAFYHLVPDRLVHWIHVVPNHGWSICFRSAKLPFLQSRPSWFVLGTTLLAIDLWPSFPTLQSTGLLHLTPLEPIYSSLLLIIVLYMINCLQLWNDCISKFKSWIYKLILSEKVRKSRKKLIFLKIGHQVGCFYGIID